MAKKTGGRGPRQKGNKYELKIAKLLDRWAKDALNLPKDVTLFSRTPRSGGWRTDVPVGLENTIVGDLVTPEWWPWAVECKDQKTWSFPAWVKQIKGELKDTRSTKGWMVVTHEHGTGNEYIFLPLEDFLRFLDWQMIALGYLGQYFPD